MLRSHALAGRAAKRQQHVEAERLWSPFSPCPTVPFGIPSELDESCLVGAHFQLEPAEPLLQFPQDAFRIVPLLNELMNRDLPKHQTFDNAAAVGQPRGR